jgi:hypothetical protein
MTKTPLPPAGDRFPVREIEAEQATPGTRVYATRDHDAIRAWASRHGAEPATGEATSSGPATVSVNDGGAGIRFNFPAAGRFRPIDWDEWFENFDAHKLTFVYEESPVEDEPHPVGAANLPASKDMRAPSTRSARYRLVPEDAL